MTVIEHDFPPDVPVSVVIDCSPPGDADVDALSLLEEGVELVRKGDHVSGGEKIQEAQALLTQAQTDRVVVRPLDDDELAQREIDQAAATAANAATEQAAADRQALIDKLTAGKATPAEMQAAIAQALGGAA